MSRRVAVLALTGFTALLVALPLLASASGSHAVDLFARIYRAGSLVFGGGHVVLPLLQDAVVPPGWIDVDKFLAGYGAAQAVPGPLFTFVAYLGTAMTPAPNGWLGGALCLMAIYLPSFLLLIGVLPFLGRNTRLADRSVRVARRQRRCGRPLNGRLLLAGLDERNPLVYRLRNWHFSPSSPRRVARSALARSDPRRDCGMGDDGVIGLAACPYADLKSPP